MVGREVATFVQSPFEGRGSQPLACRVLRSVVPDAISGWSGGTDVISPKCFSRAQQKYRLFGVAVVQCPHRHMIEAVSEAGHHEARLAIVPHCIQQMSASIVCVVAEVGPEAEDLGCVRLGDRVSGLGAEQAESLGERLGFGMVAVLQIPESSKKVIATASNSFTGN